MAREPAVSLFLLRPHLAQCLLQGSNLPMQLCCCMALLARLHLIFSAQVLLQGKLLAIHMPSARVDIFFECFSGCVEFIPCLGWKVLSLLKTRCKLLEPLVNPHLLRLYGLETLGIVGVLSAADAMQLLDAAVQEQVALELLALQPLRLASRKALGAPMNLRPEIIKGLAPCSNSFKSMRGFPEALSHLTAESLQLSGLSRQALACLSQLARHATHLGCDEGCTSSLLLNRLQ
mmetsp:Transcript_158715/g.304548  ORF Transcript_158715/g.304548 Transcript_158715/m.304548 type:complete len:233 (+) Transcript_158715:1570-2268(+)